MILISRLTRCIHSAVDNISKLLTEPNMTQTSCRRPSSLAINRARHLGDLIDRGAPTLMIEMDTSLVTPTSSSVWLKGALKLCELIYEASYVLTDEIGGFPHAAYFRWLVRIYMAKGPFWVSEIQCQRPQRLQFTNAIGNRLRLVGPEGLCPKPRIGFPKTGVEEGSVYACLFRD